MLQIFFFTSEQHIVSYSHTEFFIYRYHQVRQFNNLKNKTMKKLVFSFGLILTIAFASCSGNSEKDVKDSDISKFLGQW